MRRETKYLSDSIGTTPSSRARKYTFSIFYRHHERSGRSYPYHDYSDGQCTRQNEMQVITGVTQLDVWCGTTVKRARVTLKKNKDTDCATYGVKVDFANETSRRLLSIRIDVEDSIQSRVIKVIFNYPLTLRAIWHFHISRFHISHNIRSCCRRSRRTQSDDTCKTRNVSPCGFNTFSISESSSGQLSSAERTWSDDTVESPPQRSGRRF